MQVFSGLSIGAGVFGKRDGSGGTENQDDWAVEFDGTDYARTEILQTTDLWTTPGTLYVRFRRDGTTGLWPTTYRNLIFLRAKTVANSPKIAFGLNEAGIGKIYWMERVNNTNLHRQAVGTTPLCDNQWHLAVLTGDGARNFALYIDGQLEATASVIEPSALPIEEGPWYWATYADNNDGTIAETLVDISYAAVFSDVRTPPEIQADSQREVLSGNEGSLTHLWLMEERSGSTFFDSVGGADATLYGGNWIEI